MGVVMEGIQISFSEYSLSLKPSWVMNWEKSGRSARTEDRLNFDKKAYPEFGTYFQTQSALPHAVCPFMCFFLLSLLESTFYSKIILMFHQKKT